MPRYRMTGAAKLQLLADLAAAKGQADLAEDIRRAARLLMNMAPPPPVSEAAIAYEARLRGRPAVQ